MHSRFLWFFTCTLLATGMAAQPSAPYTRPAVGIQVGYFSGQPEFVRYFELERLRGISYGAFARFYIARGLYLQPEVQFYRRSIAGDVGYSTANSREFEFRQNLTEAGLVLQYQLGHRRFRPFAGVGASVGFFKEKVSGPIPSYCCRMGFRSSDKNVQVQGGFNWALPARLNLGLVGTYYVLAANSVQLRGRDFPSISLKRYELKMALSRFF